MKLEKIYVPELIHPECNVKETAQTDLRSTSSTQVENVSSG